MFMTDARFGSCSAASGDDAGGAAGNRHHPSASLREAGLPMRERGGAARVSGAQLLEGEPDEVRDVTSRGGRAGSSGDRTVPGREGGAGGQGGRGVGEADRPTSPPGGLSEGFSAAGALFGGIVAFLDGAEAAGCTHEELEVRLEVAGRELICQLLQDHLDVRAAREARADAVIDAEGVCHNAVEAGHCRGLETIFGQVTVTRLAYRAKQTENLYLQDGALNLPGERHSHGLRERCAIEAARGSFEEAQAAIVRATGQRLGKRQLEELARRGAVDVDSFYAQMDRPGAEDGDVVVISADGKGSS
jgi:hypothetical protein